MGDYDVEATTDRIDVREHLRFTYHFTRKYKKFKSFAERPPLLSVDYNEEFKVAQSWIKPIDGSDEPINEIVDDKKSMKSVHSSKVSKVSGRLHVTKLASLAPPINGPSESSSDFGVSNLSDDESKDVEILANQVVHRTFEVGRHPRNDSHINRTVE
jgi:hypothetical protein